MAIKKIQVEGVPLTMELAREFAGMEPLPGERELNPKHNEFLLQNVRDENFAGATWARVYCKSTGKDYRADGQHSSYVLTHLPTDGSARFPEGVLITIETYEIDDLVRDGPVIFNFFNHPRTVRSNEDAMGVYRAHIPNLGDLPRDFLQHVADGIAAYLHECRRNVPDEERDKLDKVFPPRQRGLYWKNSEYTEFCLWAYSLRDGRNAGFMARPGVVAEMLGEWRDNRDCANEFWRYVIRENHPDPDHETRELAETYKSWALSPEKRKKAAHYRKLAAKVWRHYLQERQSNAVPSQVLISQSSAAAL